MNRGFKAAEQQIKGFNANVNSTAKSSWNLVKGAAGLTGALTAASIIGLKIGNMFASWHDQMAASRRETELLYNSLASIHKLGRVSVVNEADTIEFQTAKLKENLAGSGSGASQVRVELTKLLNKAIEDFQGLFGGEQEKKPSLEAMQATIKATQERLKAEEEAAKKAAKAWEDAHAKIKSSAEQLTQSLRSPAEVYKDAVNEAANLMRFGEITWETYNRAVSKAREELDNATKSAEKFREASAAPGVGAADRFTSAGFSAVQEGKREMQRQIDLAAQQLAEQKRANALLQENNRIARENRPPAMKVVTSL